MRRAGCYCPGPLLCPPLPSQRPRCDPSVGIPALISQSTLISQRTRSVSNRLVAGSPIREIRVDWHRERAPGPVSADADPGIDGFGTPCLPYSRISHQRDLCATDASHSHSHHCHRAAEVRGRPLSACITDQTRCDPSPLIRDLDGRARGPVDEISPLIIVPSQHSLPCHATLPATPAMLSMLPDGAGLLAAQSL